MTTSSKRRDLFSGDDDARRLRHASRSAEWDALLYPTSNDKEALIQALTPSASAGTARCSRPSAPSSKPPPPELGQIANTPPRRSKRIAVPKVGECPGVDGRSANRRAGVPSLPKRVRAGGRAPVAQAAWSIYDALAALVHSHRTLPGRRSITIFSEGFGQSKRPNRSRTRRQRGDSGRVSLYIVDARGLAPENERGASSRADVDRARASRDARLG